MMSIDYIELFFNVQTHQWRGKMEICFPFGDHVYLTLDKEKIAFDEENPCEITEEMHLYAKVMNEKVEEFSILKELKEWEKCVLVEDGVHKGNELYWAKFKCENFIIAFAYDKDENFQQFSVYAEKIKIENDHNKLFEYVQLTNADLFLGEENIEQFKKVVRSKSSQRLRLLNW